MNDRITLFYFSGVEVSMLPADPCRSLLSLRILFLPQAPIKKPRPSTEDIPESVHESLRRRLQL